MLVSADYSQIELRLLAHMSGEPFLIDAFARGEDIHTVTAAVIHGVPREEVTADMRRVAKTVNFGIIYGMQAHGLSRDTGLPRQEAQRFIDQYWANLPRVKRYFDGTLAFGHEARLRRVDLRPAAHHRRPDLGQLFAARGGGADGGQHAVAGQRLRHHEDRHDPPRSKSWRGPVCGRS